MDECETFNFPVISGGKMSDSWRLRINIAILVGAIAVALHMLGIGR